MPLVRGDEVSRFVSESDPTEWFDLKKELSSGDDDAVWEQVINTAVDATAEAPHIHIRTQMMNRERVRRSIVAWSYVEDGAPVEVSDENVDRLDRHTYAELVEEVDRRNPLVLPKRKNGTAAASSPTTAATGRKRRKA